MQVWNNTAQGYYDLNGYSGIKLSLDSALLAVIRKVICPLLLRMFSPYRQKNYKRSDLVTIKDRLANLLIFGKQSSFTNSQNT